MDITNVNPIDISIIFDVKSWLDEIETPHINEMILLRKAGMSTQQAQDNFNRFINEIKSIIQSRIEITREELRPKQRQRLKIFGVRTLITRRDKG